MRVKSEENWTVGTQCLNTGSFNAAASRLYYAVFQAVLDFAFTKQRYVYKGYGAHAHMARVVRSQGKGRDHYADVFEDLMCLRITADYEPESPTLDQIRALVPDADAIRKYYLRKTEN